MHAIVWEFLARAGREAEFERAYGPQGDWVQLFRKGAGFLGTELLRDAGEPRRYLTIDRWDSADAYEAFRARVAGEYAALDERCEAMTERETPLGRFTLRASEPVR